jgi:ABC-type phosphate transport system auxiliary subunit
VARDAPRISQAEVRVRVADVQQGNHPAMLSHFAKKVNLPAKSYVHRNPVDVRNKSRQGEFMLSDVAKQKITTMQVMDELARLSARQLETVIEHASVLRLQKRKAVMPARESDLMRVINRGLNAEKSARLEQLQEKLRQETIHARERQQLLRLSDELEMLGAQRLQALIDLAALRGTSVPKLMSELGLDDAAYA